MPAPTISNYMVATDTSAGQITNSPGGTYTVHETHSIPTFLYPVGTAHQQPIMSEEVRRYLTVAEHVLIHLRASFSDNLENNTTLEHIQHILRLVREEVERAEHTGEGLNYGKYTAATRGFQELCGETGIVAAAAKYLEDVMIVIHHADYVNHLSNPDACNALAYLVSWLRSGAEGEFRLPSHIHSPFEPPKEGVYNL